MTVFTRLSPEAVAEKTIRRRVCAVTGKSTPNVAPLTKVPRLTAPVIDGSGTIAPGIGVNVLFGKVDWNNCAVTVTVLPISDKATVLLK